MTQNPGHNKGPQLESSDLMKIFENSTSRSDENFDQWFIPLRDKLYTMLCSPMKEEYRNEAFNWVSQLCLSIGDLSWLFVEEECSREEVKMFSCIASLSLNEIHIMLPLIERHLTHGVKPDIEEGKILARSANSEDYDRFGVHLVIVESLIKTLLKDTCSDPSDVVNNRLIKAMNGEELLNLLNRLKQVILLICDYLLLVHQNWLKVIENQGTEIFSSADAALRLICVWLSEEPSGLERECREFIIDLMIKNLIVPGSRTKNDLLVLAIHSVATSSEELRCVLEETPNYKENLLKYLEDVQGEQTETTGTRSERKKNRASNLRSSLVNDLLFH